ncbi:MAG: protein kinase [Planctomycetota bacterium]|nr:protein kinase [Planctomycetota bacterium]
MTKPDARDGAPADGDSRSASVERLFGEYVDRLSAGEALDAEVIRREHPDVAEELIEQLRSFADLRSGDDDGGGGGRFGSFGDYRIARELGRGGMGVVYEAHEMAMDRRVALKILPAGLMVDKRSVVRFRREARIVGKLHHPNVVAVYATGVHEETPFIAMEYVEGETLDRVLARRKPQAAEDSRKWLSGVLTGISRAFSPSTVTQATPPLEREQLSSDAAGERGGDGDHDDDDDSRSQIPSSPEGMDLSYAIRMARMFAEVADGLQHAHSKGVIHRDLKPSNLILDAEGDRRGSLKPERSGGLVPRLRLLDFGLARLEGQQSLTGSGEILGTPRYMSPEQARVRQIPVDHRTDIYSLGATLYEMLTLVPPFQGKTAHDTLGQIIHRDPRPPRQLNPRLPRDLETIVLKCLEKNPGNRYGSAEALAQELRRFARGDPIEARPQSIGERLARRLRRNKVKLAAAAVILALAATVAWFAYDSAQKSYQMTLARYDDEVADAAVVLQTTGTLYEIVGEFAWGGATYDVTRLTESLDWEGPTHERLRKAMRSLEALVREVPERSEAYFHLARGHLCEAEVELARQQLDLAIERGSVPAMVAQATLLERRGETEKANELLERARSSRDAEWAEAWLAASRATKERDWRRAIDAYGLLIEIDKEGRTPYPGADVENHLGCGIAWLQLGENDDEARSYFRVASLRSRAPEPELLLGFTYYRQGDEERAEEIFEELYRKADDPADVANYLVMLYLARFGDAVRALRWADRMPPGYFRKLWKAQCLFMTGRAADAVDIARELPTLKPDAVLSYIVAAGSLLATGGHDEAETMCREAIRVAPTSSVPWGLLANALYLQGRDLDAQGQVAAMVMKFTQSQMALLKAAAVEPDAAEPHYYLAFSYRGQGKLEEALKSLRKALSLASDDVTSGWSFDSLVAQYDLAQLLGTMKKKKESLDAYRKVVEIGKRRKRRRGAWWLPRLAQAQRITKDVSEAVRTLEMALEGPLRNPTGIGGLSMRYRRYAREALPDLPTYRAIDLALAGLAGPRLIARGSEWRYFPGSESPSQGNDWTQLDFDDTGWKSGEAGFGYDLNRTYENASTLDDMRGRYTTVYVRRRFDVEDPGALERVVLRVWADDGFVAHLNGVEVGRHLAGDREFLPHDAVATAKTTEPLTPVEITLEPGESLRGGANILAIQGLNDSPGSSDFTLDAALLVERAADVAQLEKLEKEFHLVKSGTGVAGRRDYLRARVLQLEGKHAEALELFEKRKDIDLRQPEPLLAYFRSLRVVGRSAEMGQHLREHCPGGEESWELWLATSLTDLKRTPAELLAALPCPERPGQPIESVRWLLERLSRGEALRINCGGESYESAAGVEWIGDRFFGSGSPYRYGARKYEENIPGTDDDPLFQTERFFPSWESRPAAYRIPLPPGRYRVTLHFAEIVFAKPDRRIFDVLLEGETILESYEPFHAPRGTPRAESRDVDVRDGLLDIEFRRRIQNPKISALEIESL